MLSLINRLPEETIHIGRGARAPRWYRQMIHVNLPDAHAGHAVVDIAEGRANFQTFMAKVCSPVRSKVSPSIHGVWGITADGYPQLEAIHFDATQFSVAPRPRRGYEELGHKPIPFKPASEQAEGAAQSLAEQVIEFLVVEAASGEGPVASA